MKRFVPSVDAVVALHDYFHKFYTNAPRAEYAELGPSYKRLGLVCKARALMYEDRRLDNGAVC